MRPEPEAVAVLAKRLRFQARASSGLGSPLYGDLLERAAGDVEAGGPVREVLRGHEDDPGASALALRLMGAVNRLVLEGRAPQLAARYAEQGVDRAATWDAFRAVLEADADLVRAGLERPVQTNEVGRCAALLPGLLAVAAETGLPLRLLEVGASAGLNLRWDSYRYEAGDFSWGPPDSPLRIEFELEGRFEQPPPAVSVVERRGCDESPVDPASEDGRLTLLSYVWPDQTGRVERALAAIEVAARVPVTVERAGAAGWAVERLAAPAPGCATVVYHSIVMQYLPAGERESFIAALNEAGDRASVEAPLAWLRMEPGGERADVLLTTWPGGEERHLARAGYHGTPVALCGQ